VRLFGFDERQHLGHRLAAIHLWTCQHLGNLFYLTEPFNG
jgi:hypothetical protein